MQDQIGRKDEQAPEPAAAGARPIAVYLLVLAIVALVPGFIFSAILLQRNNESQEAVVQALTQTTTQAIANGVDRQVQGMVTTLRVLATAQGLANGDFGAFHARATTALAGTGAYLIVLDGDLNQLINTRVPYGTALGKTSDPASATAALEAGDIVVSDLFYGKTAQAYVFNVLLPLRPGQGQARVLVLTQDAGSLVPVVNSRELPAGWKVALVDAAGNVMGASPGADGFTVGAPAPLAFDAETGTRGAWRYADLDGHQIVVTSWTVPETGWRVAAFAPRELIDRPFSDAVWSLILGGVLLAALVAAIVWWITNRIAASVQGLAADARRLGAGEPVTPRAYPIAEIATVSATLGEASRRRIASDNEVRFLMREVAHRSKNQMTVIAAMAKQSAKTARSVGEFVSDLERRIFGLARSTDLLLANGATGVDLRELLVHQIEPFRDLEDGAVTLTGPAVRLNNQAAQIIGMAFHELATNAVKYGAFAGEGGTLAVTWARRDDRLQIGWREHADAVEKRIERRGFGTVVLENMVGGALGARVVRTLHPDGFECTFDIPFDSVDPAGMPHGPPGTDTVPAPAPAAPGAAARQTA